MGCPRHAPLPRMAGTKEGVLWCSKQATQWVAAGWALPSTFTVSTVKSPLSPGLLMLL